MTGALITRTACHSFQFSGRMENKVCNTGVYRRAKCNAMESVMAYTSIIFSHNGRVSRDSLEDKAFIALSISITTRIDNETVEADFAMSSENIWQPISGNCVEQR